MTSRLTLDIEAQRRALVDVLRWHPSAVVRVTGEDGEEVTVLELGQDGVVTKEPPATPARLRVAATTSTSCPFSIFKMDAPTYLRVDEKGQVELVSGDCVVLKIFGKDATAADWPRELQHQQLMRN